MYDHIAFDFRLYFSVYGNNEFRHTLLDSNVCIVQYESEHVKGCMSVLQTCANP
jgi:hypothetical protein